MISMIQVGFKGRKRHRNEESKISGIPSNMAYIHGYTFTLFTIAITDCQNLSSEKKTWLLQQ